MEIIKHPIGCYSVRRVKKADIKEDDIVLTRLNKTWVLNEEETIHFIDLELKYLSSHSTDIDDFFNGLTYGEYLRQLRSFLSIRLTRKGIGQF